ALPVRWCIRVRLRVPIAASLPGFPAASTRVSSFASRAKRGALFRPELAAAAWAESHAPLVLELVAEPAERPGRRTQAVAHKRMAERRPAALQDESAGSQLQPGRRSFCSVTLLRPPLP